MSNRDGYCIHGVYVGGCGVDWMCGHCEMGENQWYPTTKWVSSFILKGDQRVPYIDIDKTFATQEEAIAYSDRWQELVNENEAGDPSTIIALIEYPVPSGYWGERDRDNERHASVYDCHNGKDYDTYYRFDHELEWLKDRVEDVNAKLGEERFYVSAFSAPWSAIEVVDLLHSIVEKELSNDE